MEGIIRQEFGSDFHLCLEEDWLSDEAFFDLNKSSFFLSGRAALYALVEFGIREHNWQSLYIPSYYCHEVSDYIEDLPIDIKTYQFNPYISNNIKVADNETVAIIVLDCFGFEIEDVIVANKSKTHLIEDLTHNLSRLNQSRADYAFASLRKQLPVPTGGILFSQLPIPKGAIDNCIEADEIAYGKLCAMQLKRDYINGVIDNKSIFRSSFLRSEALLSKKLGNVSNAQVSQIIIGKLNINAILERLKHNLARTIKKIKSTESFVVNNNQLKGSGLVLNFKDMELRNKFRNSLIEEKIYPAILWPNQKTRFDKEYENTILYIHVDYRHTLKDIEYITDKINLFAN